jgi:hypothetical protein
MNDISKKAIDIVRKTMAWWLGLSSVSSYGMKSGKTESGQNDYKHEQRFVACKATPERKALNICDFAMRSKSEKDVL